MKINFCDRCNHNGDNICAKYGAIDWDKSIECGDYEGPAVNTPTKQKPRQRPIRNAGISSLVFARNVRAMMEGRNMTTKALASMVGVTEAAAYSWTSGKNFPTLESLAKLAVVFNVHMEEFLDIEIKE